jgi:ribokinase
VPPDPDAPDPAQIAVIGPIAQDVAVRIDELPPPGAATVTDTLYLEPGGKAGNPAVACARLGARVRLLGAVGDDALGRQLLRRLEADGVDVSLVRRWPETRTGYIIHLVEPDARRRYVEFRGANERLAWSAGDVAGACAGCGFALISTALPRRAVEAAVAGARAAGARVVADLAGEPDTARAVLAGAEVVRADAGEAEALTGLAVDGFEPAAAAARRLAQEGPELVVVQAGEEGDLYLRGERELRIERLPVAAVDPTGAGDALVATLTVLLGSGLELEAAGRLASAAAAHTVGHLGGRPAFRSREHLEELLASTQGIRAGE